MGKIIMLGLISLNLCCGDHRRDLSQDGEYLASQIELYNKSIAALQAKIPFVDETKQAKLKQQIDDIESDKNILKGMCDTIGFRFDDKVKISEKEKMEIDK